MKRTRILVWDLPVRMFHWLLVASFVGAFLTAESERVRDVHVALGYAFVGLLAFRLVWGVVGSRYARFSSFAFGPKAVAAYLRSLLTRRPEHYVGHNPAGSWVIYALLLLGVTVGISGHVLSVGADGHWVEELHEGIANALLALVIVHVAGAVVSSVLHRENLVAAMVTGYKSGSPDEAIGKTRWPVAAALAAAVAGLWAMGPQITGALPDSGTTMGQEAEHSHPSRHRHHGHDG